MNIDVAGFELKVVRFLNDLEIICFYDDSDDFKCVILFPKMFYYGVDDENEFDTINLQNWMPNDFYEYQRAEISKTNILYTAFPSVYLSTIYLESLTRSIEDPEIVEEIMFSLNEIKSLTEPRVLH